MTHNGSHEPGEKEERASMEVRPAATRRTFSAAYRRELVELAATLTPSERGALLRREGLDSSHLARWKAELRRGGIEARRRGPAANPAAAEVKRLERENARLVAKLRQAELIIEAQKGLAEILGTVLPSEAEILGSPSAKRDRG